MRTRAGRVLQVLPDGRIVVDRDGRTYTVPAESPAFVPGDFVSFSADTADTEDTEDTGRPATLLARPDDAAAFPRPDGDFYRLQRDGRRRLRTLQQRARLLAETRRFFADRDFLEIEAPLLVPSPGLEVHLAAFSAHPDVLGETRYLITSPEYQLKRLLTAGLTRIYSLGKVFRHGEVGPHHNPEFTMLEWYRAYEGWQAVAADVAALVEALAVALHGAPRFPARGQILDVQTPWPQLSVREAMARFAGVRLRGDEDTDELAARLREAGHTLSSTSEQAPRWDDLFFGVFLDHVEPRLAEERSADGTALRPVVLCDWPAPLCALARPKPGDPAVVERFEAYIAGLELCNGFGELCDPAEQRRRFDADRAERTRRGLPVYPTDERFLSALAEGMPPSGGVALGVDRLVMLLLDAHHIRDVLPFAADEL